MDSSHVMIFFDPSADVWAVLILLRRREGASLVVGRWTDRAIANDCKITGKILAGYLRMIVTIDTVRETFQDLLLESSKQE